MTRGSTATTLLTLALAGALCLPAPGSARQAAAGKPAAASTPASAPAAAAPGGVRGDVLLQLDDAEKKLVALAEATPPEKFTWRPAEGVRSVGEVYQHIAAGSYFVASVWGAKAPAGVNFMTLERDGGDKAKTIASLKAAFAYLRGAITALSDKELEGPVNFGGQKGTVRQALLEAAVHAHEHLGQEIAYARTNGIVPPWSAGAQGQQKPSGK